MQITTSNQFCNLSNIPDIFVWSIPKKFNQRFEKYLAKVETSKQYSQQIKNAYLQEPNFEQLKLAHLITPPANFPIDKLNIDGQRPQDSIFRMTDLLIFPHDFKGKLPSNGVYQEEYLEIIQIFEKIISNQSIIKIDPEVKEKFINLILMDLVILLTRPTSRKLIKEILKRDDPLLITCGQRAQYNHINNQISLDKVKIGSHVEYLEFKERKKGYFIPAPHYIILAHELIHVYHRMIFDEQFFKNELHDAQPTSNIHYDNRSEQLTISGKCDGGIVQDLLISESAICKEFDLPCRDDHRPGGCFPPNINGDHIFKNGFSAMHYAAENGALLNVLKWIQEGINVNLKSARQETPLMLATQAKQDEIIQLLVNPHIHLCDDQSLR